MVLDHREGMYELGSVRSEFGCELFWCFQNIRSSTSTNKCRFYILEYFGSWHHFWSLPRKPQQLCPREPFLVVVLLVGGILKGKPSGDLEIRWSDALCKFYGHPGDRFVACGQQTRCHSLKCFRCLITSCSISEKWFTMILFMATVLLVNLVFAVDKS